jgi:Uma2 family endonuclease
MGEAGIFHPEARLELIEGEIIEMSPVGGRHISCVNRATALFANRLAGKAMVSVQNPIVLSRYTEPRPDILLARPRDDFYATKRISADDTLLAIEISDTTIRYDRNRKMPLYAQAGVSELWIENLSSDVVLVFRDPGPQTYSTMLTFHRGESLSIVAFPEITFTVDELLG